MSNFVNHELFVCNCNDISHQFVLSTWNFNDGSPELEISIKLNHYLPWYKRIFVAFKYLFKLDRGEYNVVLLNNEDLNRLQKSLESFKKLSEKELVENYKF